MKSLLINKYVIALCGFLVWLTFFDRYNIKTQYNLSEVLYNLENQKINYEEQIIITQKKQKDLDNDREKFAREKYLMHRDNEDVFIIEGLEKKDN